MATEAQPPPQYPLYSTTFTIHRLSPLHHTDTPLNDTSLTVYAARLRDILTGDVLRGVRVGLAENSDDALARVGALKTINWTLLRNEDDWQTAEDESRMDVDTTTLEKLSRGIHVAIVYEKATYTALLLHDPSAEVGGNEETAFSQYPLLLIRMPGALRGTFLDFLATNFDARASIMRLPSQFLVTTLENYLENIVPMGDGSVEASIEQTILRTFMKDVVITFGFNLPNGHNSLKTIDITIPKDDLWGMLVRGKKLRLQQRPNTNDTKEPFTAALHIYIQSHLALDLQHPLVAISKIACGSFVLGTEGRAKLFRLDPNAGNDDVQGKATHSLVKSLIDQAASSALGGVDSS